MEKVTKVNRNIRNYLLYIYKEIHNTYNPRWIYIVDMPLPISSNIVCCTECFSTDNPPLNSIPYYEVVIQDMYMHSNKDILYILKTSMYGSISPFNQEYM